MKNVHIECQCTLLKSIITNFVSSMESCPSSKDVKEFKKEQRYIRKVKKKLDELVYLLENIPE